MPNLYFYKQKDLYVGHTLTEAPQPQAFRMHNHNIMELYCFLRGKGIYHIEGSEYILEPGDVLIMRPSESHYIDLDCTQPYERIVVNFSQEFLQPIDPNGWLLRPFLERAAGKHNLYKSKDFAPMLQAMVRPDGEPKVNILCGLLPLLSLIHRQWQNRTEEEDLAGETTEYRLIHYVNRHLTEDLTLDSICEKFFLSKSQLQRIFKKATGTTVWQYITVKRLAMAKQLLEAGEQPTHIYTRCGFTDYSTFYRAYVKQYGHCPNGA